MTYDDSEENFHNWLFSPLKFFRSRKGPERNRSTSVGSPPWSPYMGRMNEMDMFLDSEPLLSSVTSAAEKDGGLFIRYFLSPVRNLIGVVKHKLC